MKSGPFRKPSAEFWLLLGLSTVIPALLICFALLPGRVERGVSSVSPFLKLGPQAISTSAAGTNYTLFNCQVVGLNSSATCYDPYQMRRAYNIDALLNAGFDGKGKTIVVIDAYQSPNIVQQLNFYNSFYGLPSLNGLGGSPNAGLGTFTRVAPDGLTPFVPGDPNMTAWAEEISLDVTWAHAIAPGANITLVLARSNQNADILSATKYGVDNNLGDVISQSFGENESCMDPNLVAQQHQVFANATLKGITLYASAGDDGAGQPTCDGSSLVQAASSPAVDPLVSAVGGTELHAAGYCLSALACNPAANPAPGTYGGEVVWNESLIGIGAGGDGFSLVHDEPPYQQGTTSWRQAAGGSPTSRTIPLIVWCADLLQYPWSAGGLLFCSAAPAPVLRSGRPFWLLSIRRPDMTWALSIRRCTTLVKLRASIPLLASTSPAVPTQPSGCRASRPELVGMRLRAWVLQRPINWLLT